MRGPPKQPQPGISSRAFCCSPFRDLSIQMNAWCTTLPSPGRRSTALIQRFSVEGFERTKQRYSSSASAETVKGRRGFKSRSGFPRGHTWEKSGNFDRSLSAPFGAPPYTQATMRSRSREESRGSLAKSPYPGTARHAGILRSRTSSLMAFAQGRASVYVVRGIGAIPPAWWQPMQRLARMRTISLLKVALVVMRSCAFPCHSRENEGKSEAATAQSNPLAFNIGKLYSKESHHGGKGSRVKRVKRQRYPPGPLPSDRVRPGAGGAPSKSTARRSA